MNRSILTAVALLAPVLGYAQVSCTREGLQAAADLYIGAQTKGDISGLPLAKGLGYVENFKTMSINDGLIKTAMKIDHTRSLLDTSTCQTFTEVIVSDKAGPYALGTSHSVKIQTGTERPATRQLSGGTLPLCADGLARRKDAGV